MTREQNTPHVSSKEASYNIRQIETGLKQLGFSRAEAKKFCADLKHVIDVGERTCNGGKT
ncbi:hypothetical protein [Methylomonas sp. MgM2]